MQCALEYMHEPLQELTLMKITTTHNINFSTGGWWHVKDQNSGKVNEVMSLIWDRGKDRQRTDMWD